jgi:prepilin-type N-terminal cleavage/methylation domain-containing protein
MTCRRGFTLIELLTVLFMVAILSISAGTFLVDALRSLHLAEKRVQMNRFVPLLHDVWRNALRDSNPASWQLVDGDLVAGDLRIGRSGHRLVIQFQGRERALPLPSITDTEIAIEHPGAGADCAVLTVAWEERWLTSVTTNRVRLVACGEGRDAAGQ